MSKIKNGGLHQYGAKPLEQQQFGTAGVEGVNGRSGGGAEIQDMRRVERRLSDLLAC